MRPARKWLVLLLACAGMAAVAPALWEYRPWQPRYRLGVRLPDAGGLEAGSKVRRGLLSIGHVVDVEDQGGGCVVWLAIGAEHPVAASARVDVAAPPGLAPYVRVRQDPRSRARAVPGTVLEGAPPAEPSGLARTIADLQAAAAAAREASQAAARLLTAPVVVDALADLRRASASAAAATSQAVQLAGELRAVAADVARVARAYGPEGSAGRELAATASRLASATADVAAVTGRVRRAAEDPRLAAVGEQVLAAAGSTAQAARQAAAWRDRLTFGARSSTFLGLGARRVESELCAWAALDRKTSAILGLTTGRRGGLMAQAGTAIGGDARLRFGTYRGEVGAGFDAGPVSLDAYDLDDPRLQVTGRAGRAVLRVDDLLGERELLVGWGTRW